MIYIKLFESWVNESEILKRYWLMPSRSPIKIQYEDGVGLATSDNPNDPWYIINPEDGGGFQWFDEFYLITDKHKQMASDLFAQWNGGEDGGKSFPDTVEDLMNTLGLESVMSVRDDITNSEDREEEFEKWCHDGGPYLIDPYDENPAWRIDMSYFPDLDDDDEEYDEEYDEDEDGNDE